jgi:hypothetical protein
MKRRYLDEDIAILLKDSQRYYYLKDTLLRLRDRLNTVGRGKLNITKDQAIEIVKFFIDTAFNPDRCLCSCKYMYFCELPEGHEGPHIDRGFKWEHEYDDGVVEEISRLENK